MSENKQRCGVALLFCVVFALATFTQVAAQVREQRRVTGMQLGEVAEGSRVTIISDSALNDYEAFRSGDRFYVKIPLADFTPAVPHFRSAGLESVQVQKSGDNLIVSFKLQLGASARVEQRGNRLDVIFAAANRGSYNSANSGSSRTPGSGLDRGRDAAGPVPVDTVAASRGRVVTERAGDGTESRVAQNPWVSTSPQRDLNKGTKKGAKDQAGSGNTTTPSSSPLASPSPRSSPSSSLPPPNSASYQPLSSATPAGSPTARTVAGSSGSGGISNLRQRGVRWVAANRLATLLGALILLSLVFYLVMALRGRKEKVVKAKRAKAPKVQPKYSADDELNQIPGSSPAFAPERTTRPNQVPDQRDNRASQPAPAPAAAAAVSLHHEFGLAGPTITSPTAEPDEYSSEEEEREVFEL